MPAPLPLSTTIVRRDGPQDRLLILLHGYGEPARDLTDRLHLIDPDGRFVVAVPQAPYERRGLAIWHRAISAGAEADGQYLASLAAVDALIGDLGDDLDVHTTDAVVGGFSQGGGLALGLLLASDVRHRPAAAFGVCSFPPPIQGFRVDRAAIAGRPFFLSSACQDRFAPIEVSRSGAAHLQDVGLHLTYIESAGEHEMTDTAAAAIGTWLTALADDEPHQANDLLAGVGGPHHFDGLWDFA